MFQKILKKFLLGPILMSFPLYFSACKYDKELLNAGPNPPANCNAVPTSFNAVIFPLVSTKCAIAGCHDASASGGQVFQNYTQISGAKDRIHVRAIVQRSMPATGFLTTAEYNSLRCWIEAGAPNN
ncbi:MAG: hypothetical protein Q7T76_15170 [Ferruginibacter sp.]|nr:hypothetical protein [Ferruginibacter sp.]